jgi:hypothetical protein
MSLLCFGSRAAGQLEIQQRVSAAAATALALHRYRYRPKVDGRRGPFLLREVDCEAVSYVVRSTSTSTYLVPT